MDSIFLLLFNYFDEEFSARVILAFKKMKTIL